MGGVHGLGIKKVIKLVINIFKWFHQKLISKVKFKKSANKIGLGQMDTIFFKINIWLPLGKV